LVNDPFRIFHNFRTSHLEVFNPGLYIIDRQSPEDDINEPHKISLCWNQPQLLISLVEKAPFLASLNLTGYEELTDLALEYIVGKVGSSTGLKKLTEITLPKKCFVTTEGIRVLIEHLPILELIQNQGKMGVMISFKHLELPPGQDHFNLKEFGQLESLSSGGLDEDLHEDPNFGEVQGWTPSLEDMTNLMNTCPLIKSLKLLMDDKDLYKTAKMLEDKCTWDITEMDIHLMTGEFVTIGINRLSVTFAETLTSLKITVLDCLCWHSIEVIGKYCSELKVFHLELWDKVIEVEDDDQIGLERPYFSNLQDLKIKCEDYIEPLPRSVMKYFFQCDSHHLKIVQFVAHLSWLKHDNLITSWTLQNLQR
jgi:hypothetical protein